MLRHHRLNIELQEKEGKEEEHALGQTVNSHTRHPSNMIDSVLDAALSLEHHWPLILPVSTLQFGESDALKSVCTVSLSLCLCTVANL